MTPVGTLRTLCLCGVLAGICVAQKANPGATAQPDVRPAIFQRGLQTAQVVQAQGIVNAQLSSASFHAASNEEVDAMEHTLEQYVVAFENLDLTQIKQVWPNLDSKHMKAFKDVFSAMKSESAAPRLGLQCAVPNVSAGVADVQCLETVVYRVGKGKTKEAGPAKISIQLKEESSHWVMQDMKGSG
jgi:hypothetical protein